MICGARRCRIQLTCNDIVERTRVSEEGLRAELLEKLKTECGGLTVAIVQLRKEHEILHDSVRQDHGCLAELNKTVAS